MQSRRHRE
jgi:hypothetical protein